MSKSNQRQTKPMRPNLPARPPRLTSDVPRRSLKLIASAPPVKRYLRTTKKTRNPFLHRKCIFFCRPRRRPNNSRKYATGTVQASTGYVDGKVRIQRPLDDETPILLVSSTILPIPTQDASFTNVAVSYKKTKAFPLRARESR